MGWNPGCTGRYRKYWKILECVVMPGRLNVMNDWNVWNIWNALGRSCSWNAWNAFGRSCRMNGCTQRSLCLLHVECLFWTGWRALCLLHVELDSGLDEELFVFWMEYGVLDGYPNVECRIWRIPWTSSCRMQFLEVSVEDCNATASNSLKWIAGEVICF